MKDAQAPLGPDEVARWTRVGMLAALSLLLSYAETFVPIPIPGVKLGLANIAVLVALSLGDVSGAICVALIKVLAAGFLFGSPLTLAYSLVGTTLSLVGMVPLSQLRTMRLEMVSVVGALLHELGQLIVASVVLGSNVVWYASPALLTAGCATGVLCGVLSAGVRDAIPRNFDPPIHRDASPVPDPPPARPPAASIAAFLSLIVFVIAVFRVGDLTSLGVCVLIAGVSCFATRTPTRVLARTARPLLLVSLFTLVMQLLVSPQSALAETARSTARLACVLLASTAFMRYMPTDDLTGTIAWLVSPLARIGVRTQGFVLAFDTAVRLVPSLATIVRDEVEAHGGRVGIRGIRDMLSSVTRRLFKGEG